MISREQYEKAAAKATEMLQRTGISITAEENKRWEVADFGLDRLDETGLQIITYVNTKRCCAKEIVLFPHQTCPEHWHPTINGVPGKEETFRCRWGTVYLFVPGKPDAAPACRPPEGSEAYYHAARQIVLKAGDQYTVLPDTPHWFQAGSEGAVVSEFSTQSTDEQDVFRDPRIVRVPVIAGPTLPY